MVQCINNVEHVNYGHDEPPCKLYGNSPLRNQCIIITFQCMTYTDTKVTVGMSHDTLIQKLTMEVGKSCLYSNPSIFTTLYFKTTLDYKTI